ncbi:MAG TPA: hypothetical protein VF870_05020 [Ignavibacteriaceae bacterium]
MIDENKVIGMLQAKALGCLDAEEDKELQEFIDAGHVFPWDEFGINQNLASLLPLALPLELPDAELKDRVALKLIKLSEQLRINKILEEDKFEVEEEFEENVNEFTNIPEAFIDPPIEIETEETVVEDNLAETLNSDESNFNLDEIVLPEFEGGEVANENPEESVNIESPFETLVDEAQIDYPKVEEAPIDELLTEPEIQPIKKTAQEDISIKHIISEANSVKDSFKSLKTDKSEEIEISNDQPDLTKRSVAEKMFKAIEQDFDSLKYHYEESERKTTRGLLFAYVVIGLLIALLIFSFFKFSSDINNLENEVKELKSKLSSSLYQEQKTNSDHSFFS